MRKAKKRSPCAITPAPFHLDDCTGCHSFLDCARKQDDFDADYICWHCFWLGKVEDCCVKVIKQTMLDPEERYPLCPHCGNIVEDTKE